MNLVHTYEKTQFPGQTSLFLAGPSPTRPDQISWRGQAVLILRELGFDGTVFVPELNPSGTPDPDYPHQLEWEHQNLESCGVIVFWVPRNMATGWMGMTTNVEFGRYGGSKRALYGRPDHAEHVKYLDWYYQKTHPGAIIHNDLRRLLEQAVLLAATLHRLES